MRAIFVLCEGNHDAAFVTRSLGALAGARWVPGPIGRLPAPLGTKHDPKNPKRVVARSVIATRYERRHMDELELQDAAHAPVPTFEAVVEVPAEDTLYVMIRCGGDGVASQVYELLADVRAVMDVATDLDALALAFVFDADDAGVGAREASFARDYAARFLTEPGRSLRHGQWQEGRHGPVGLFVFHEPRTRTGTLEDVLAPLVHEQWPQRWDAAGAYLDAHATPADRIHRGRAEYQKARIGTVGQFMFPGGPMTEVVRNRAAGLRRERFTGPVPRQLVEFLLGAPW